MNLIAQLEAEQIVAYLVFEVGSLRPRGVYAPRTCTRSEHQVLPEAEVPNAELEIAVEPAAAQPAAGARLRSAGRPRC